MGTSRQNPPALTERSRTTRNWIHLGKASTTSNLSETPIHPALRFRQTIGNASAQHLPKSCPAYPNRCPFGGACHECPSPIQAKLRVGQANDKYEREADRVAEAVMRMPTSDIEGTGDSGKIHVPTIQRMCAGCGVNHDEDEELRRQAEPEEEEEALQAKEYPGRAPALHRNLESNIMAFRGKGQPLPDPARSFLEPRLGYDFGKVRVHTGPRAEEAARSVQARAFTLGKDIVFGTGQYAPTTVEGRRLLTHELTHVVQQGAAGRFEGLSAGGRIEPQVQIKEPGVVDAVDAGRATIQRQEAPSTTSVPQQTVPRPTALPLDQGWALTPAEGLPSQIVAAVPEDTLTVVPYPILEMTAPGMGGAGTGLTTSINAMLRTAGFAAAGENAIGLVGIPSYDPFRAIAKGTGSLLPDSVLSSWGHTAVYARTGNQIQVVRGFSIESIRGMLGEVSAVKSGTASTAGAFAEDAWLFTKTGAQSIEFAVPREVAEQLMRELPGPGKAGSLSYTARPATFRVSIGSACAGTNCVLYAVEQAESALGGRVAVQTPQGPVPITSLTGKGPPVPGTASQGQFIKALKAVEAGTMEAVPIEGAESAVASGMPRGLIILKWTGRIFLVVGAGAVVAEVAMAPEEEKVRTAVGAGAGFVGGLAAGAAAGLVCGPGAPVCSIVLGIGFGIAGGLAARAAAEGAYDLATGRIETTSSYQSVPFVCFAGHTKVLLADSSTKPISEVAVGDRVISFDESEKRARPCVVSKVFENGPHETLRVELDDGRVVQATGRHRVSTVKGWTEIRRLRAGDALHCYDAQRSGPPRTRTITRITQAPADGPVYDLEVEHCHNYFAEGVLAHNKLP